MRRFFDQGIVLASKPVDSFVQGSSDSIAARSVETPSVETPLGLDGQNFLTSPIGDSSVTAE